AAEGITAMLLEMDGIDTAAVEECSAAYMAELTTADGEVEALIAAVPAEQRIMVTNHEAFGYFADRHEFEVVGTVIPSGSTGGAASAGELAELAEIIEAEGVPAIFGDTSAPTDVAEALAAEVGGDVQVVELYTESLGEPGSDGETYIAMVVTNAERISGALA
ncbi:MAG: metal ABC transporter substrate-binding protein, partial [Actinomycetota bacterium]